MSMDKWFFDQARLGNVYHSHNTTHGAITVLSATSTGLMIENPYGSGKILVMKNGEVTGTTLSTIRQVGVAVASAVTVALSATTTAAVIHNAKLQGSNIDTGVGRSYSIATLASTPVWYKNMGNLRVTAAVTGESALKVDFNGDTIVMPGTFIAFATLTAAADGLCSFTWAEIDE